MIVRKYNVYHRALCCKYFLRCEVLALEKGVYAYYVPTRRITEIFIVLY